MSAPERADPAIGTPIGSVGEERTALTEPVRPADAWTAPEPWPKRLLRAGKAWILAAVTHYSITQLVSLADDSSAPSVRQSVFMGLWAATIVFVGSRKGSMMPASPMLVFGGVTVGLTLLAGGVMLATGVAGRSGIGIDELGGMLSIGLFLGGAMVWMGLKARRAERALEDGHRTERVAPVLISRAELAARVEENQVLQADETRRLMRRMSIGMAVVLGIVAFPYTRVFGAEPPEIVGFGIFFGGWGAFGLFARSMARRGRELASRLGLICPACNEPYNGAFVNHRYLKNIVEIGRCPRCGARIVTEDGT